MDKRATHSLTGTVGAHPRLAAEAPVAETAAIDRAGAQDDPDLRKVLRAIASRIDVVLDERAAAGDEPEGRHRAADAWSTVVGKRATDTTSDLRRHALSTTVLRISPDGRVDVDDRESDARDGAPESRDASGRHADADRSDAPPAAAATLQGVEVATPATADNGSVRDTSLDSPAPAATDRTDVEDRLRAARERLVTRRTNAATARVDTRRPRAPRLGFRSWRRSDVRILVQRLLIGLAIVGASAAVSILIT